MEIVTPQQVKFCQINGKLAGRKQKFECVVYQNREFIKIKFYTLHQLRNAEKDCQKLLERNIPGIIIKEKRGYSLWILLKSLSSKKYFSKLIIPIDYEVKSETKVHNFKRKINKIIEIASVKTSFYSLTLLLFIGITIGITFLHAILFQPSEVLRYSNTSSPSNSEINSSFFSTMSESSGNTIVSRFTEVERVPFGKFNYGGSTTWAPIRKEVDSAIIAAWPEFRLRYVQHPTLAPGSSTGIKMLLHNQLNFAQSSRPLKASERQQAQKLGFTLKQIPVAMDGIAIATHGDLDIPGLTLDQLKDIYTGKITNWKQVGGPNLAIVAYSKSVAQSGTAQFFANQVLGEEQWGKNVRYVDNITLTIREVAVNKGAIFYASAPEIIGQCSVKPLPIGRSADNLVAAYIKPLVTPEQCPQSRNQIDRQVFMTENYPLIRKLYVIVKQNGGIEEQSGLAYTQMLLSQEGQKLIQTAGMIPIITELVPKLATNYLS